MPEQQAAEVSARNAQRLVDDWTNCIQQAQTAITQSLGPLQNAADPAAWQRAWCDAVGQSANAFLRSPPFLEMMRKRLAALIHERVQAPPCEPGTPPGSPQSTTANGMPAADPGCDEEHRDWTMPGATNHEVVAEQPLFRLIRYSTGNAKYANPVLICFALINRPYILDLQEDRSVVRVLLGRGFDVYLIDWRPPPDVDQSTRLHHYVCDGLSSAVEFACLLSGASQVNLLGYCMGGTLSAIFTAMHPERVRNLALLATPIDFSGDESLLNLWAREDQFQVDAFIDAFGNCPAEFLQSCFELLKPIQSTVQKFAAFSERVSDTAFVDNFLAMERWANDSVPVAGETFREFVKLLYQQNRLIRGALYLAGVPVRLAAITCPVLLLVAEKDHLVPPAATLAIEQHVGSGDVKSLSIDAGHIGLAVSSKAHAQLWPAAADWLIERTQTV